MKMRLLAIMAACKNELAAGKYVPSEQLNNLTKSVGISGTTLEELRAEACTKLNTTLAKDHIGLSCTFCDEVG